MPRARRFKLFIVGGTLLLCAFVVGARGPLRELAFGRADAGPASGPGTIVAEPPRTEPAEIRSAALDEAAVNELLPYLAGAKWVQYDPIAIVRVRPDQMLKQDWAEHAGGRMTLRTNNWGFREDAPTLPAPKGPRVLVVGDSHTFGLVENRESFANLLEEWLRPKSARPAPEVINAGVSGTGPFETRALVGALLPELRPDLVLFVLYTGNDFINAQAFADFELRRPRNPLPQDAKQRFASARERERVRMAQNSSQLHSFKFRKDDAEFALLATIGCVREMAQYCRERGSRLLVAVLPTKEDVDACDLEHMQSVREELQLADEDFALTRQLAARFEQALSESGISVVDLLPAMSDRPVTLYWHADHHLNVAGHAAVARALLGPVREQLGR